MKKFINCFKKYFIYFGLWAVIAIFLVSWEFSLLTTIPENKKIDILINASTNSLDEASFKEILDANKPEYLKEVNYRYNDSNNGMFYQVMQTYGDVEADLYILSSDIIDEYEELDTYFYKFDENTCNEIISSDLTYYKRNNDTYGILLNQEYLKEEGKTFYILFANDSLHLGKLNNQELDGAITICKALLGK